MLWGNRSPGKRFFPTGRSERVEAGGCEEGSVSHEGSVGQDRKAKQQEQGNFREAGCQDGAGGERNSSNR